MPLHPDDAEYREKLRKPPPKRSVESDTEPDAESHEGGESDLSDLSDREDVQMEEPASDSKSLIGTTVPDSEPEEQEMPLVQNHAYPIIESRTETVLDIVSNKLPSAIVVGADTLGALEDVAMKDGSL